MGVRKVIVMRLEKLGRSRLWLAEQMDERPATVYRFLGGKQSMRSDKLEAMFDILGLEVRAKS